MESRTDESSPLLPKYSSKQKQKSGPNSPCQQVWRFLSLMTVEPAFFLFTLGFGLENVTIVNLWVDKVCHHTYPMNICEALDSGQYPHEQDNVQSVVNRYKSVYAQWIEYIPAVFVVIILGGWSDGRDRRLPVVLPFVGFFLKCLGVIANCYWWSISPQYMLLASIPVGLGGGMMALMLGCSAYLSTVSTVKSRTVRLSLLNIILFASLPFGKALAAILYKRFGYIGVFGCEAAFNACSLAYSLLRLEKHPRRTSPAASLSSTSASKSQGNNPVGLCQFLSPTRLKKTISVAWKKREGGYRKQIVGHVIIIACLLFDLGANSFSFLYTRKKFDWNFYTYTVWSIVSSPAAGLGTVFILPLLSYRYKVEDSIMGFMGSASFMFMNVIIATAPYGWVMYLAVGASVFSGMCFASSRGALSKLVPEDEVGSIFAVVALGETIMPLVNGSFFTAIYNATLDIFPGTVFAVAAVMFAFVCCVYAWLLTRPDRPVFR